MALDDASRLAVPLPAATLHEAAGRVVSAEAVVLGGEEREEVTRAVRRLPAWRGTPSSRPPSAWDMPSSMVAYRRGSRS